MRTLIVLLFSCVSLLADTIQYESNFDVAYAKAKQQHKMLLCDFCLPQCTECIRTLQIWNSKSCVQTITNNFIVLKSDISKDPKWQKYGKGLGGASLPLTVFVNPATGADPQARYVGLMNSVIWNIIFKRELAQ